MRTLWAVLEPVICAPWCEKGDGHIDAGHPDDQYCYSGYAEVHLSQPQPQADDEGPDWLDVLLRRRPGSDQTLLIIHTQDPDVDTELTLAEAERLVAVLRLRISEGHA